MTFPSRTFLPSKTIKSFCIVFENNKMDFQKTERKSHNINLEFGGADFFSFCADI